MTVSTSSYLKSHYDSAAVLGAKVVGSDFALEIVGFEAYWLLCKQAPWPELSPQGEIEVPMPLGSLAYQPQQIKPAQQGSISFYETVLGSVDKMMESIVENGGTFDAWLYEGTPQKYIRRKKIQDCFLQIDPIDRDWENRSSPMLITGTLFFHYFGQTEEGNTSDYR